MYTEAYYMLLNEDHTFMAEIHVLFWSSFNSHGHSTKIELQDNYFAKLVNLKTENAIEVIVHEDYVPHLKYEMNPLKGKTSGGFRQSLYASNSLLVPFC